jgi:hypothetical protein
MADMADERPEDGPPQRTKTMKKTILITAATLALAACDDPNQFDGASVEQTCPDDGEGAEDGTPAVPGTPEDAEPDPDGDLTVPGDSPAGVHDVEVSIAEGDEGTDILVEFRNGATGTGATHIVLAPQMTLELVQDGQTIIAVEADLVHMRNAVDDGVTCGSVFDESYEVVFADAQAIGTAAESGGTLVHAIAMERAIAENADLAELLSSSGVMPVDCEDACDAGGSIAGGGIAGAGAAWCCVGSAGLGCLPCAGGAGAGGAALGLFISAGCKGLFC